jgi:hypothetical protein
MIGSGAEWISGYERETAKTVGRLLPRACTQLKLGVNERGFEEVADAVRRRELFEYSRRETARTNYWETLVVVILVLCSWGTCILVLFGK